MKESYGEDLANHTSLESCGNCSNAEAEALTEGQKIGDRPRFSDYKKRDLSLFFYSTPER